MSSLVYTEKEVLTVSFSTLVINLQRLNERFGTVSEFCDQYDIHGLTNGKMLVIKSMMIPSDFLRDIAEDILKPKGLIEDKDFVILFENCKWPERCEQMLRDKETAGKIPGTEHLEWLDSNVRFDGEFIWVK